MWPFVHHEQTILSGLYAEGSGRASSLHEFPQAETLRRESDVLGGCCKYLSKMFQGPSPTIGIKERFSKIEETATSKRKKAAMEIYNKFLSPDSPYEININGALKREIEAKLLETPRDLFLQAQKAIFLLMVYGSFDYFINSEQKHYEQSTHLQIEIDQVIDWSRLQVRILFLRSHSVMVKRKQLRQRKRRKHSVLEGEHAG